MGHLPLATMLLLRVILSQVREMTEVVNNGGKEMIYAPYLKKENVHMVSVGKTVIIIILMSATDIGKMALILNMDVILALVAKTSTLIYVPIP